MVAAFSVGRRCLAGAAALAACAISLNCEQVLDLDTEYADIGQRMCACDSIPAAMADDQLACIAIINNRIENADEQTRKAWFDTFIKECEAGCSDYGKCLKKAPLCVGPGEACGDDAYCCTGKCPNLGANKACEGAPF